MIPFLPADPAQHLAVVSHGSDIEALIGGAAALPRILADIRSVGGERSFVYVAGWNCESDLAVPTGQATDSLGAALAAAASAGAQIRVLLWSSVDDLRTLASMISAQPGIIGLPIAAASAQIASEMQTFFVLPAGNNKRTVALVNGLPKPSDASAYLDSRTLLFGSHHQKIVLIGSEDSVVAYVGGIEFSTDRLYASGRDGKPLAGAPLFDVSVRVTGPAVGSVLSTFTDRWTASTPTHLQSPALRGLGVPAPSGTGDLDAQVTHTYAAGCPYPIHITSAARAIAAAIRSCQQFFYMEDQYYVGTADLAAAIGDTLAADPDRWGVIVVAADASVTDLPDVVYRRHQMLASLAATYRGRLLIFERMGDNGGPTGPTAYVHSKLTIVDDVTAVIGSANSNYRSWSHDSEIMLTVQDPKGPGGTAPATWRSIRSLRAALWMRHLTATPGQTSTTVSQSDVGDPAKARSLWLDTWLNTRAAHVRAYDPTSTAARPAWAYLPAVGDLIWRSAIDPRG